MNYHPIHNAVNAGNGLSVSQRALLAAELVNAGKLSFAQAAALLRVSVGYLHTAMKATPRDRARIALGGSLTLSRLHNWRRYPSERQRLQAECQRLIAELKQASADLTPVAADLQRALTASEHAKCALELRLAEVAPVVMEAAE